MNRSAVTGLIVAVCLASGGYATALDAQSPLPPQTPKTWSYQVDSRGNRVARDNRLVRPDGSWREEIRQGNCITVKERSATGEYRETRQCEPHAPR
jgi:hypothetical protein